MIKLHDQGIYLVNGIEIVPESQSQRLPQADKESARQGTIAYGILTAHNQAADSRQPKQGGQEKPVHHITLLWLSYRIYYSILLDNLQERKLSVR